MAHRTKLVVVLGAIALSALAAPGCGGGTDTSGSTSAGASGGTGGTGGATGGTGGATGGTGGATGGTGGSTGGTGGAGGSTASDDFGAQGSAFVNAGGQAKSANYRMVFTLGQSTVNQGPTSSANYRLHGGLVGATGSYK